MELLTPLQRRLLYEIGHSPLCDAFFLTGGTALAAFYLHHRYSLDLDLFTDSPAAVAQVPPIMQEVAGRLGLEITFTRTLGAFLECFLWLAVALAQVEQVQVLPRMIKPVSIAALKSFFLTRAKELMDRASQPPPE